MKLSKVIKELQELEKEHGGDIQTNVYLYKEMTPVRYIGVRDVHSLRNGVEFAKPEIFIEGDKYQDL